MPIDPYGDRRISIDRDVDDAVIITGDNNKVSIFEDKANSTSHIVNSKHRKRQALIKKVQNEFNCLMERNLCNYNHGYLINIEKEIQQNQVDPHAAENIRYKPSENRVITSGSEFTEFVKTTGYSLLILGQPGSGKTITLLKIMEDILIMLIENKNHEIPVYIDIKKWKNKRINFIAWVESELSTFYKTNVDDIKEFIKDGEIILMIDGLDSLELEQQRKIIDCINSSLSSFKIVVCCRNIDYQRCRILLKLTSAVILRELKNEEIYNFLAKYEPLEYSIDEQTWELVRGDLNILEIIENPFFLYLFKFVIKKDQNFISIWTKYYVDDQEKYRYLFKKYIENMLQDNVSLNDKVSWLFFLARMMNEERKKEFFIEEIQPSWLQKRQEKREYRQVNIIVSCLCSLPLSIIIGILVTKDISDIDFVRQVAIISVISFVITATASIFVCNQKIIFPLETLKISLKRVRNRIPLNTWIDRFAGSITYILSTHVDSLMKSQDFLDWFKNIDRFKSIFINGLIGFTFPLHSIIKYLNRKFRGYKLKIEQRGYANEGIHRTFKNAIFLSLLVAVIGFIIGIIVYIFSFALVYHSWDYKKYSMINAGLILGLINFIFGIVVFGLSCIQHFSLRLILWKHKHISLHYSLFLDEVAIKHGLLQRTGGGYSFIHPLVQDYFANMDYYK